MDKDGRSPEVADRLRATAEDLIELVSAQVRLARLELADEARGLGRRLVLAAPLVLLLLAGYGLLALGAVVALSDRVGLAAALALVGAANLLAGAAGVGLYLRRR